MRIYGRIMKTDTTRNALCMKTDTTRNAQCKNHN